MPRQKPAARHLSQQPLHGRKASAPDDAEVDDFVTETPADGDGAERAKSPPVASLDSRKKKKELKKKKGGSGRGAMVVDDSPQSNSHSFRYNNWRRIVQVDAAELVPFALAAVLPALRSSYVQIGYVIVPLPQPAPRGSSPTLLRHTKSPSLVLKVGEELLRRELSASLMSQLSAYRVVLAPSLVSDDTGLVRETEEDPVLFINVFVRLDSPLPIEIFSFAVCNMLVADLPPWLDTDDCYRDELFDANALFEFNSTIISRSQGTITNGALHEAMQAALLRGGLLTELRDYQRQGVAWMHDVLFSPPVTVEEEPSDFEWGLDLYLPIRLLGSSSSSSKGDLAWYHLVSGELCLSTRPPPRALPRSVLLCDHMGVGKTLQILCLVLYRKTLDADGGGKGCSTSDFMSSAGIGGRYPTLVCGPAEDSCFCGSTRQFSREEHLFLIRCSACGRVCHASCAGYDASAEGGCSGGLEGEDDGRYCLHPSRYLCLPCVCSRAYEHKLPSAATCVLVPDTLLAQWAGEVKKHLRGQALRVMVYDSATRLRELALGKHYGRIRSMNPLLLRDYDVILVGISLFSREYHLANHAVEKKASGRRGSSPLLAYFPPPIMCLTFKLLVVDETQKLDSSAGASHILQLARRLSCERRVCVSGTPLKNSSLQDLQSLSHFLAISPLEDAKLWRSLFRPMVHGSLPVGARFHVKVLADVFKYIMLRRTKGMIARQLGLPRKVVLVRSLKFTPFENALYLDYEADCRRRYAEGSSESGLFMYRQLLQDLRVGCCHPSLFDRTLLRILPSRRRSRASPGPNPNLSRARPISEIMILKIENAKLFTEERQRALLLCLSGMAAQAVLMAQAQPFLADSSGATTDAQQASASYYLTALLCYLHAFSIFSGNRQLALLSTLAEVRFDPLFVGDGCGSKELPTTSPMVLAWVLRPLDDGASHKRQRLEDDGAPALWLPLPSKRKLPPSPGDHGEGGDGIAASVLPGVSEPLSLRLRLHSNKRILEMTVRQKFHSVVRRIEQELQGGGGTVHALLFPKALVLRAMTGELSETVHTLQLPLPTSPARTLAFSFSNWARRRVYSVDVETVHPQALLLTRAPGGALLHRWQDFRRVGSQKDLSTMCLHAAFDVSFRDAAVEPDLFQELHVVHNLLDIAHADGAADVVEAALARHTAAAINVEDLRLPRVGLAHAPPTDTSSPSSSSSALLEALRARRDLIISQHLGGVTQRNSLAQLRLQETGARVAAEAAEIKSLLEAVGARGLPASHGFLAAALPLIFDKHDFVDGLAEIVERGEGAYVRFRRVCNSAGALLLLVSAEAEELEAARAAALASAKAYADLARLTRAQKDEARDCRACRSYLSKKGRVCFHCVRRGLLDGYQAKVVGFRSSRELLTSAADGDEGDGEGDGGRRFENMQVDGPLLMLARYTRRCVPRLGDALLARRLMELADADIRRLSRLAEETRALFACWRAYQDLLKGHDDIEQCQYRLGFEQFPAPELILPAYQQSFAELAAARVDLQNANGKVNFFAEQERMYRLQRRRSVLEDAAASGHFEGSDSGDEEKAEGSECKVCLLEIFSSDDYITHLMCGHYFHSECINSWLQMKLKCPLCKQRVLLKELITVSPMRERELLRRALHPAPSHDIRGMLDMEGAGEESSGGGESRVVMLPPSAGGAINGAARRRIVGEYGSKIEAVVGDILELFGGSSQFGQDGPDEPGDDGPTADKAIVFSQWPDMLLIVQDALETNGIRCAMCKETSDFAARNSPLEKFLTTTRFNILLMPLRLGADGLDLSRANHIFLLEPILASSVELQAVNRIDRLGQCKTPYVHKYYFVGSVEERIIGKQLLAGAGDAGDDTFLDARGQVAFTGSAASRSAPFSPPSLAL